MTQTRPNAFITGSSSGIGRAVARKFLSEGYAVWGTARDLTRLGSLADDPNFHPIRLDLDDAAGAIQAYVMAHAAAPGGFDVVVNNAGYGVFARFDVTPFDVWSKQLNAMLLTTLQLAQRQLLDLRAKGSGVMVNVASLATEFPLPYMSGYNVAKAGLSALSESLLIETAGTGVRVVDFRPGDFRTDFNTTMLQLSPATEPSASDSRMKGAWEVLDQNIATAPAVEKAAADLFRAVVTEARGVVRSGSFFQSRLAPLFERLVPRRWARAVRWHYFGLK